MDEIHQEARRVEHWLTQDRPQTIRTRGRVRTRGGVVRPAGVTVKHIEDVSEMLEQLQAEIPDAPWVVVIDGRLDAFAEHVCQQVKAARPSAKFWLIGSVQETPLGSALADFTPLHLNPQNTDDRRFMENLVADLVVVSTAMQAALEERVRRWLPQARYIVVANLDASLLEELHGLEHTGRGKAEICVVQH